MSPTSVSNADYKPGVVLSLYIIACVLIALYGMSRDYENALRMQH